MSVMEKLVRRSLALPAKVPAVLPAVRYLRSQSVAIVMYHGETDSIGMYRREK